MKLFLIVLLSSSCIYSMQNSNDKIPESNEQYYNQKVVEISERYLIKNAEPIPGNIVLPLHIVGFLRTLNDNNWYKVDITIRSKL